MSAALEQAERRILRFLGKVSGAILSFLGVITAGCGNMPADYGVPPAVNISGAILSSQEGIQGIQVRMISSDSSHVFDSCISDHYGYFWLYADVSHFSPPDSVIVSARDIDGELNGLFLPVDTLLFFDEDSLGSQEILVYADIFLTPAKTDH